MEHSTSKDRTAHARDPELPYFDNSKDKMDSYLSRFEESQQLINGICFYGPQI